MVGFFQHPPVRVLLLFLLFVLLMNTLFVGIYFTWYSLLLAPVFVFVLFILPKAKHLDNFVLDTEAWQMGKATDLKDPKKPITFNMALQVKVLSLGVLGLGSPGAGKTVSLAVGLMAFISRELPRRRAEAEIKKELKKKFKKDMPVDPALLDNVKNDGFLYAEGKGDKEIYQELVAAGVTPNFFFSTELASSDTMNLFDGDAATVLEIWQTILVPKDTDPYYGPAQERALSVLINLVKDLSDKANLPCSLKDIYVLLNVEDAGPYIMQLAQAHKVNPDILGEADSYLKEPYDDRRQKVEGLINRLSPYCTGLLSDRINCYNPTINLSDIVRNNQSIYFHLPISKKAKDVSYAFCERLQAISRERQNYKTSTHIWHCIFDDWGGLFYDNFTTATARFRAAGLPVSFFFQSKGQMDEVASTFADIMDDTVATKIFLRMLGQKSCEWASRSMGTYEAYKYTISDREQEGLDGSSLGLAAEPRVLPQDFRDLSDGECYCATNLKASKGKAKSLYTKFRFPLAEKIIDDVSSIDWPTPVLNPPKDGLGLWEKFVSQNTIQSADSTIQIETPPGKGGSENIDPPDDDSAPDIEPTADEQEDEDLW